MSTESKPKDLTAIESTAAADVMVSKLVDQRVNFSNLAVASYDQQRERAKQTFDVKPNRRNRKAHNIAIGNLASAALSQGLAKAGRLESDTLASQHAQEYSVEYHDLALIQAHKEGVTINVERPLSIGKEVESQ